MTGPAPLVAIVVAAAAGYRRDLDAAIALLDEAGAGRTILAVNDVLVALPEVDHFVSQHPEKLVEAPDRWADRRAEAGLSTDYVRWSLAAAPFVDRLASRRWRGGSSSLLAVNVALLDLGADAVILAGVPLDARPNELNPLWSDGWDPFERFRYAWDRSDAADLRPRVRSFSGGWTSLTFGLPTLEWLEALPPALS